jgi:hypothetical protein
MKETSAVETGKLQAILDDYLAANPQAVSEPLSEFCRYAERRLRQGTGPTGVGGWLAFLCFALVVGVPLRSMFNLIGAYLAVSRLTGKNLTTFQNMLICDAAIHIPVAILSARAGIALWKKWPGAVGTAKNFLIIALLCSLLSSFLALAWSTSLADEIRTGMMPEIMLSVIQSFIFFGIWYSYLSVSKRVSNTYGQ